MLTRRPVDIGPGPVQGPSVSARTRPVRRSGRPISPTEGMSVLPPRSRVSSAPTPAAAISATAPGSQTAATATSRKPWSSTAAITVMQSSVPPEPTLSAWSSRITGPASIF